MMDMLRRYTEGDLETGEEDSKTLLERLAYWDVLTELGNRAAFSKMLSECGQMVNVFCVVFDINNLKMCNDRYGHSEGDKMIVDTAECIKGAFGSIGDCFRIGGDEFAALIQNKEEKDILDAIENLNVLISEKNHQRKMPVSIAFGYAMREGTGEDICVISHR